MTKFIRKFDQKLDSGLNSPLFDLILYDIQFSGDVFPAIRNNQLDFYHCGKLFSFESSKFITHYKYIPGINDSRGIDYLHENKLAGYLRSVTFKDGYCRIKELCKLYAGEEATQVSKLYKHFRELFKSSSLPDIIPLDIEICFHANEVAGKQKYDRIDMLFYNTKLQTLRFCEVKCFSDSRLYANTPNIPEIVGQMKRYETQINNRSNEIIQAYQRNVDDLNRIFNLKIPHPVRIDDKPIFLLITDFDNPQKKAVVTPMKYDLTGHGIDCYAIGNISEINLCNMWNRI